ncbi:MAG: hypothetical protein JWR38_740 [Mucilaginibacter sp.]|nr:hypothetical protein [Mucilaginibacter sp.]
MAVAFILQVKHYRIIVIVIKRQLINCLFLFTLANIISYEFDVLHKSRFNYSKRYV